MSKIIGKGITFDDVLLIPAYSEVIPNDVDLRTHYKEDSVTDSAYEFRNGYGYGTQNGNCNGKTGRYRCDSQKYVNCGAGRGS